jgi:hypothetical protein
MMRAEGGRRGIVEVEPGDGRACGRGGRLAAFVEGLEERRAFERF